MKLYCKNLNHIHTLPSARKSLRSFDKKTVTTELTHIISKKIKSSNELIGPIRALSDYRKYVEPKKIIEIGF